VFSSFEPLIIKFLAPLYPHVNTFVGNHSWSWTW